MYDDTIVAPSTPQGKSAIAVVRLSGKDALKIALKLFHPLSELKPRRATVGRFYDWEKGAYFDEGLATYFPAPRSYTGEDVVELSCHGSPVIVARILELCTAAGARLAKPGEFTYRAFLNGKMDLLQAEAVADIVDAVSYEQVRLSFSQLEGALSRTIEQLRAGLIEVISLLETEVEFPDEGISIAKEDVLKALKKIKERVKELLSYFDYSKALHDGISLVIAGRANVGKSSLFNALLQENRAIVTEVPGTTRDFLRERIVIKGVPFILTDTAGFHPESRDAVELEGIRRTEKLLQEADGIIFMVDASQPLQQEDYFLASKLKGKKAVLVLNKMDLPQKLEERELEKLGLEGPVVRISALRHTNLDQLKEVLHSTFVPEAKPSQGLVNLRQKIALERALDHLERAEKAVSAGETEEVVLEEMRQAAAQLEALTGKIKVGDLLEEIFSRFCIGK